jgi:predicted DsbA family dithiol-disulfide isomerase
VTSENRSIVVFADVACPFTHVGLQRLVRERRARGGGPQLLVLAWPLELVNGHPLDPAFIAEEVEDIRAQVAPDLFRGFDPAAFPASSLPALALTSRARAVGPELGEQVALALRHRLFEDGQDIADPDVLRAVAAAHGLEVPDAADAEAVHAEWRDGEARGVVGSPHFFAGEHDWFCPALDIARQGEHLRIRFDVEGFDRFSRDAGLGA